MKTEEWTIAERLQIFRRVAIDVENEQWLNDPKMTLFREETHKLSEAIGALLHGRDSNVVIGAVMQTIKNIIGYKHREHQLEMLEETKAEEEREKVAEIITARSPIVN